MSWLYLSFAIAFEVAGTISMRLSEGLTKTLPSTMIFVFYSVAFVLMTLAIRAIDLGIAYAVWAASGTALVAIIGVIGFGEEVNTLKVISLVLVITGVVGLQLSTNTYSR